VVTNNQPDVLAQEVRVTVKGSTRSIRAPGVPTVPLLRCSGFHFPSFGNKLDEAPVNGGSASTKPRLQPERMSCGVSRATRHTPFDAQISDEQFYDIWLWLVVVLRPVLVGGKYTFQRSTG